MKYLCLEMELLILCLKNNITPGNDYDEVIQSLLKKRILALALYGAQTREQRQFATSELNRPDPDCRLLYLTPEMLNKSGVCQSIIQKLHQSRNLSRYIMDHNKFGLLSSYNTVPIHVGNRF